MDAPLVMHVSEYGSRVFTNSKMEKYLHRVGKPEEKTADIDDSPNPQKMASGGAGHDSSSRKFGLKLFKLRSKRHLVGSAHVPKTNECPTRR